jgi:hypothetical protein
MAHCSVLSWHAVNRMCKNWGPSFSAINTTINLVSVQSNPDALLSEPICSLCPVYMHGVVFAQKNIYKFQMGILIHVYCASFIISVVWATNAQLSHKLSHSYMFWHYHVILRELVVNALPSYTRISNAGVGNTVYN